MNSVLLIVLDGYGIAAPGPGNAISLAETKNINSYLHLYPNTQLKASGEAVGLPQGEVGSTEVGHLNMGAGKIIYQSLPRINLAIADNTFYTNEVFLNSFAHIRKTGGNLHLMGLLGSGTVHASMDHLYALLFLCKEQKIQNVYIHLITDGRDSPPQAAASFAAELQKKIDELGVGNVASVMGRYYGMDRDKRWDRVEKAYRCLTVGQGQQAANWQDAINNAYKMGKTDEFIEPTNIIANGAPVSLIKKGDAVIFYNFRIDRPRELTKAFVLDNFERDANITSYDPYATKYHGTHLMEEKVLVNPFIRGPKIEDLFFVTMTEYEKNLPVQVAFPPRGVNMPLGRVIADHRLPQLRVAESEKERFVTFYFNGLREEKLELEEDLIVPSQKVKTYDQKPEMSAKEITETLLKKINEGNYPFILVNYANADMVGHTGNLKATIKAVTVLDECIGKVVEAALARNMTILITGDHGNAEEMINPTTGKPSTEHTSNLVYFIAISQEYAGRNVRLQSGILADIAPTILGILGIIRPAEMTGRDLLEELRV